MSHLSLTLPVQAPATAVYDLVADPRRGPDWQTLLVELGDVAGRPGGVGSSFVGYYRVAGRKMAGRFVVTAAESPTLFQLNGTTTGGWVRWTTVIAAAGAECTMTVKLEYELPGEIVGSLFGMLTGNRMEREFRRTYENLKRVAEAAGRQAPIATEPPTPDHVAAH
jgi:Polyketide cyclase / dehydrase and lipid transport